MNGVRTFIDTNILIYAFTADEPDKQKIALQFLDSCLPILSTQVIKELTNVLLKRTVSNHQNIRELISEITEIATVVYEDMELINAAFDLHERYHFSFYDCLILAAALGSNCQVLLSEDMQNGQIIGGLKIINPFKQ